VLVKTLDDEGLVLLRILIEREVVNDGVIEQGERLPCQVWVEILSPRALRELCGGGYWQREGLLL
jgi:hypothetical protein